MSTQQHLSSIAEYKKIVFLKYCNENGVKKIQTDEISISNKHRKSGLFCWFIFEKIIFTLKFYESVFFVFSIALITAKLIYKKKLLRKRYFKLWIR